MSTIYIRILVKMKIVCLNKCNVKITLFDFKKKTITQFNKLAQIQIASNLNFNPTIDHQMHVTKSKTNKNNLKAIANNEKKVITNIKETQERKGGMGKKVGTKGDLCRFVGRHE
jgi:hypothetical protein